MVRFPFLFNFLFSREENGPKIFVARDFIGKGVTKIITFGILSALHVSEQRMHNMTL